MRIFEGMGLWIFNLSACVNGKPTDSDEAIDHILTVMEITGAAWAAPKVSNGILPYNRTGTSTYYGPDTTLPKFYQAMRKAGRPCLGWQYIYGNAPIQEADQAADQITKYGLDGFMLDPETEYETAAKTVAAMQYMRHLRTRCPKTPLAMASWRYPSLHPTMPWTAFMDEMSAERGDVWMPQAYWEGNNSPTGAGQELRKTVKELALVKNLPILPIGSVYGQRQKNLTYWLPTEDQVEDFANTAAALNLPGISWWSWDTMVAKDASGPALAGKYGWWAAVVQAGKRWQDDDPTPPATPPGPAVVSPAVWMQYIDAWARTKGYDGPKPG
jgi:hypothetical protein